MSWFDGTALANLAKSALKEAQKTIDKALDIQEDGGETAVTNTSKTNDFFETWGVEEGPDKVAEDGVIREQWGSFTGSFFSNPAVQQNESKSVNLVATQPHKNEFLLLAKEEPKTSAPLATPESGLTPSEDCIDLVQSDKENIDLNQIKNESDSVFLQQNNTGKTVGEDNVADEKVIVRVSRTKRNSSNRNSYTSNRLSVISTESQKSSESVEVLSSFSCTTSPDGEQPSISTSSSMGLPHSSSYTDSVEVIDSLASPSSVEVIWEHSSSDTGQSSDADLSPSVLQPSVTVVNNQVTILSDVSPDSVEVITEGNDMDEELSIGESYTSLSESTAATILEPPFSSRMYESYTDLSQSSSKFLSGESTPDISYKLPLTQHGSSDLLSDLYNLVDTGAPALSKSLELGGKLSELRKCQEVADQHSVMSKSMNQRYDNKLRCSPAGEETTRQQRVKHVSQCLSDDGTVSDSKTVIANDSSCEGTIMESSCEDAGPGSSSQTSSMYVKHLLEEAICDVALTRDTSPTLSDKSKSDVVKVGSEQTSGHTSGDELETTTSSDIEIISRYSPNGDSSSTASRHSPAKLLQQNSRNKLSLVAVDILGKTNQVKTKGHQREPSEASSGGSEDSTGSEVDKLSKKLTDLTEILEVRESKLVELSRSNLELQERNQELKKQLEQARMETALRLSMGSTEALFAEKDEIIGQLREEGEKLSKIHLKQSNLIKTLRNQEVALQSNIKTHKQQVTELTEEVEKLKKSVYVKDETERNKADVISKLTGKINRQDEYIAKMLSQMEDAVGKAERLRNTLDTMEKELEECKKQLSSKEIELTNVRQDLECNTRKELVVKLEQVECSSKQTQGELVRQLADLREQMKIVEEKHSIRENNCRQEINNWMRRLQEAENRNEELSQSVSTASRPLLRQIESLQSTMSHQRDSWEKQERSLLDKLEEAQSHLNSLLQHEKSFREETLTLRSRVNHLESQLSAALEQNKECQARIKLLQDTSVESRTQYEREKSCSNEAQEMLKSQLLELKREVTCVEHQLAVERAATEAEKRRVVVLQEQQQQQQQQQQHRDSSSPQSSPTLSFGRDSVSSAMWTQFNEDVFETSSMSGRNNVYHSLSTSTSLLEGLQAQLKLREGEVSQLQWELHKKDTDRLALSTELAKLTNKLEEQAVRLLEVDKLAVLQANYDALLQMYGEKVEEVDELRLDLEDVKEMYKSQIEQLLKKDKHADSPVMS